MGQIDPPLPQIGLGKIGAFQNTMLLYEIVATPLPTKGFFITNEGFKMRHYMLFYLKEHQNYQK